MISQNTIIERLDELKPFLQKEYSVKSIGLFGSFSDNSFSDESDIDILVELEKPIGWKYFPAGADLQSVPFVLLRFFVLLKPCYFLCLETKKVTKENSRLQRRPFLVRFLDEQKMNKSPF